jgi:hypothetical protein
MAVRLAKTNNPQKLSGGSSRNFLYPLQNNQLARLVTRFSSGRRTFRHPRSGGSQFHVDRTSQNIILTKVTNLLRFFAPAPSARPAHSCTKHGLPYRRFKAMSEAIGLFLPLRSQQNLYAYRPPGLPVDLASVRYGEHAADEIHWRG